MAIELDNELRKTALRDSRSAVSVHGVSESSQAQEKAAGEGDARRPSKSRPRREGALMGFSETRAQVSATLAVSKST